MWNWIRKDRDLEREIRAHMEWEAEDLADAGVPPDEARRAAMRVFGNATAIREVCYEMSARTAAGTLLQDLRYAVRILGRNPGFAAAAVLTLALGIGANTAIFSVVDAALLRPLPYADPDRLEAIHIEVPQFRDTSPSMAVRPRDYLEWLRYDTGFSALSLFGAAAMNLTGQGEPERLDALRVSANLFSLLDVQPERGRAFLPGEDVPGRGGVVLLSHDFWVRRFGGEPSILNRAIALDGRPYVVAGILPAGFLFPTGKQFHPLLPLPPRIDVWVPLELSAPEIMQTGTFNFGVIGRLRPGISPERAEQQLDAVSVRFGQQEFRTFHLDLHTRLTPIREIFTGRVRQGLLLLLGAVGLLLAIACVNLANLLMARMTGRSREFATRAALGARRGRLMRQLLTESLLLASLGAVAGAALGMWGIRAATALAPRDLPELQRAAINGPVLGFTFAIALLTGFVFGLLPAMGIFRRDLHAELKEGGRDFSGCVRAGRLHRVLVTVEVALSTALLAAAGLLLHSFVKVMNVDCGFAVERIVAVDLALPANQYVGARQRAAFFREAVRRLSALPGVTAAGAVTDLPLTNEANTSLIQLESDTRLRLDRPVAASRSATPGYFESMQIRLLSGRDFRDQEPAPVAVISQALAKALWPNEPLPGMIGRRFRHSSMGIVSIIGVVADVRTAALDAQPMPQVYRPYDQVTPAEMSLVIRSAREPGDLARAATAEIRGIDPNLPVPALRTMYQMVSAAVAQRRFQTVLIAVFALVALGLAVVGTYGVVSYSVRRRTREVGLRMALGARPEDVMR
ncbi:MAG: ABC transporter permease [Acidobacteriia bacterium]|nr:ABC transporter permease [Terriglobia bacterium]